MASDKTIFIRESIGKKNSTAGRVGTVLFVVALIVVNYWVFLKDNLTISAPSLEQTVQPPPGNELPATELQQIPIPVETQDARPATTVAGELKRGETVLQALQKLGVQTEEALPVINSMEDVMDFRSAKAGNTFRIEMDPLGKVVNFEFRQSATDIYIVTRDDEGKLAAAKKNVPKEIRVTSLACTIQGSLYRSFQRCGGDSKLANLFMTLFAWDFNFFEQAREGDTVRMLVEKLYVDGRFMDYGRILAAEYEGQVVGRMSVFHFEDPDGIEGYYTRDGLALRKEFLKVPVDYASSEEANRGKQVFEPKRVREDGRVAVRYPAPPSSPVWSVASGTVTFAGKVPKEGFVVEIQHEGGYRSRYTHLGTVSKGVTEGAQVFQKSVIGKVTDRRGKFGGYVLFSLEKGKKFVDHMKENFPGGEPVPERYKGEFDKMVNRFIDELRSLDVMGLEDSQA